MARDRIGEGLRLQVGFVGRGILASDLRSEIAETEGEQSVFQATFIVDIRLQFQILATAYLEPWRAIGLYNCVLFRENDR